MIDELRKNMDMQVEILREIARCNSRVQGADNEERKILSETVNSLMERLRIINRAIPDILNNVPITQKLGEKSKKFQFVQIKNINGMDVTISAGDKEKFLKELKISEGLLRKIKKRPTEIKEVGEEFVAARGYVKVANRFFLRMSSNLIKGGYFKSLIGEINKANLDILLEVYIATMFFSTLLALILSLGLVTILLFIDIGTSFPFISLYSGNYVSRLAVLIWIPIVVTLSTFIFIYWYPSSERKNCAQKIEQELPFAVIHMSAIAGSGIEPVQIFKIIGLSKEYPYLRKEIRKVLNQINLYGHDLVTAINNVIKNTPSQKLSELFTGVSTTITSGGKLSDFFAKRAETLLIDYRLEREKYTKIAETFMDIYISVVIAAPMILMLVVVLMSLSGLGMPFTPGEVNLATIAAIALINIIFLALLRLKQPTY